MKRDLTTAVDAAAEVLHARSGDETAWENVPPMTKFALREYLTPLIHAAFQATEPPTEGATSDAMVQG